MKQWGVSAPLPASTWQCEFTSIARSSFYYTRTRAKGLMRLIDTQFSVHAVV